MARYIDAELLKENFAERLNNRFGILIKIDDAAVDLGLAMADTPTADVVEVKHGEWLDDVKVISTVGMADIKALVGYRCSLCGRTEVAKEPYCNCGAKMDGGKSE